MKTHFNLKFIVIALFMGLLSCKNNISAGVGSDGKSLDSTRTNADTTNVKRDTLKTLK